MAVTNPFTSGRIEGLRQRVTAQTRDQLIETTERLTEDNQRAIRAELGKDASVERYVDGVLGKPVEQVNENGFTLTEFHMLSAVVDDAFQMLIQASPTGPEEGGHYRDDHRLFVNGTERDSDIEGNLIEFRPGDVVVIVNTRPYARKIEGGFRHVGGSKRSMANRRPGLSVQAPDGVYQVTANELRRRYGDVVSVLYVFKSLDGRNDKNGGYPALEMTGNL